MTAVFLLCTIILFVLQTLSMKLQHARTSAPEASGELCVFASGGRGHGRRPSGCAGHVHRKPRDAAARHCLRRAVRTDDLVLQPGHRQAGPLSYTTFYFSASMLVPAFAGVLLFGEALTFTLAAAVALFLAAFWCLNVAPGGAQKPSPAGWRCVR